MSAFTHTKPRYTIKDAMFLLSMGRPLLYEAMNSGELRAYKVGGRTFISPLALEDYVKVCEQKQPYRYPK